MDVWDLFLSCIVSVYPKSLHVGILLPNKAGNYAVSCEAELLLFAEVITVSFDTETPLQSFRHKTPVQSFGESKKLTPSPVFSPSSV